MTGIQRKAHSISQQIPKASQVLIDYEYWLMRHYGAAGTYLVNARTFMKSYVQGGDVQSQLLDYLVNRSPTLKSILRRFLIFLEKRDFRYLINDLNETKLPISNPFVKLYLLSNQDRLKSKGSLSIYATVLGGYFSFIKNDITRINKRTASKFILSPTLSDYTKRLYKSILKSFCEWALVYQSLDSKELSREQRLVKKALKNISVQSLREIVSIKVIIPRSLSGTYHKDSLSEKQRDRLLKLAKTPRDKSILSLMAWNGLRSIEVLRLTVSDIRLSEGKLIVWGKGRSEKSKEIIKLSSVAKRELKNYLVKNNIKRGHLFPTLKRVELDELVTGYLSKLRIRGKLTPHSLRHTAGQIMYDKKIPLELIQKTLRHADMRTTMIYAQKAVDRNYFKRLKRF